MLIMITPSKLTSSKSTMMPNPQFSQLINTDMSPPFPLPPLSSTLTTLSFMASLLDSLFLKLNNSKLSLTSLLSFLNELASLNELELDIGLTSWSSSQLELASNLIEL
ncbi:hypothetical protein Pint_26147 [Pistacia integerrima]|uniref:Uncharacterized protein n=1 Tax=Pistacia integerrima TaxID=434235 RepID=A0ACC0YEA1_9ROSI|nr:hypothetical protein Pint_26147 [Pistacia integerrima]